MNHSRPLDHYPPGTATFASMFAAPLTGVQRSYQAIAVPTAIISGLVTIAFARIPELHPAVPWPALRLGVVR